MISCKIILSEEISDATFGRFNFHAVNFTNSIAVPCFPYTLRSSFLCLIDYTPGNINRNAKLTLQFDNLPEKVEVIGNIGGSDQRSGIFASWNTDYLLPNEGTLKLTFSCDGYTQLKEWKIVLGEGAKRSNTAAIPSTAVIDGRKKWDPLVHLKREVVGKLLIADPYLTPEFLRRFLDSSTSNWIVQVITSHEYFKDLSPNDIDLKITHPNLEVRFDDLFHDRLICRDDEEIYSFGASLKDLNHGRVSFFQRVYDQQSTRNCIELLNESWSKATPR